MSLMSSFRTSVAVIAAGGIGGMMVSASTANADLMVDIGPNDTVQSGYREFSDDSATTTDNSEGQLITATQTYTGTGFGDVTLTLEATDSGDAGTEPDNLNFNSRTAPSGTGLDNLLEDFAEDRANNLIVTFTGLDKGTYTITTYHHDGTKGDPGEHTTIDVDNGVTDRDGVITATTTNNESDTIPQPATFSFDAVGNPVVMEMDSSARINGFELSIPEPASLAIVGVGGLMMLSGRRRRR